jgi:riboflavin kinase/FMN adenylyltransferase
LPGAKESPPPFVRISFLKLFREVAALTDAVRGGAVTVGNFDGVHRGHAAIVEHLREQARRVGGPAVVFTFDPHPVRVLRPAQAPPPLTWTDRKAQLLAELGVDAVIAYPTDEELLQLTDRAFFDNILCGLLQAKALVEGTNFCFGRDRTGTIDVLRRYAAEAGMTVDVVEPLTLHGDVVSSSRVRKLIAAGQIDEARQLLTRPYRIRGLVRHGASRGAKIGFPTANVDAVDTLLPGPGVYAGRASVAGNLWPAAINVGPNPTFGEQALKVEVHLLGFHGNLYGMPLEVDFEARLRDVRTFSGIEELKTQLQSDVQRARDILKS